MSTFSNLPKWAQGVIAVVAVAGSGLAIYGTYRTIKNRIGRENSKKEEKAVKDEISDLKKQGITPTINKADAETMANKIHTACDGYGTDGNAIKRVFEQLKNKADVLYLQQVYGTRKISSGAYNPAPNFEGTLMATLTDELDAIQISILNKLLASKNIDVKI